MKTILIHNMSTPFAGFRDVARESSLNHGPLGFHCLHAKTAFALSRITHQHRENIFVHRSERFINFVRFLQISVDLLWNIFIHM